MERDELGRKILEDCQLHGNFKLRSGETSDTYLDKYQAFAKTSILIPLVSHLKNLIPTDTEVLAGIVLGGVPLATALALETGIDLAFIRPEAKKYGTVRIIEGADVTNKHVLLVEDITTTGGAIIDSALALKSYNAKVAHCLCMIRRQVTLKPKLERLGINLISLFSLDELENPYRFGDCF